MPAISIGRFIAEIHILYSPPRRALSTRKQMGQVLREFAAAGVEKTSGFTVPAICRWMDLHPLRTAVTTRSLLRCLRSALTYAVAARYLHETPFTFWRPTQFIREDVAPAKRLPRHRSLGDITRILDRADVEASAGDWGRRRLRALVYVYAYLGLRAAEALHLWTADLELARNALTLQAHPEDGWRPKTLRSAAVLPLAGPLAAVLADWWPETGCRWLFPGLKRRGPWTSGGPGVRPLDQVAELGQRAGVAGLTIASFRKTIGTYAKSWGFSQLELKALLRHSNVETQRWYDEEAIESLRPAVAKVQFPRIA